MVEPALDRGTRGLVAAGSGLVLVWIALAFALQAESQLARVLVVVPLLVVISAVSLACWVAGQAWRKTAACGKPSQASAKGNRGRVKEIVHA
mmetsp:Transcript_3978/g.25047  ORF Transcript_3978/g.25047 Transcript_3978/m.25047 type:complete len:92 (-) Transcript_3978:4370-4645(-)